MTHGAQANADEDFKACGRAVIQRNSVEQPTRLTKSATKGGLLMSPYGTKTKGKDSVARTHRMQTMTASKLQTANLLSSNAKNASKANKLELPYLSNRSNSKPTMMTTKSMSV